MKNKYFTIFLFGIILICKDPMLFGFGDQDLGPDSENKKGGPELTIINNSKGTLFFDGIVFWDGSNVGGKDGFSQVVIPSGKSKILRSSNGPRYFWGYKNNVNGGFDVTTKAEYNTKDFSVTLPTKQGEFDLDPHCTAAAQKSSCPKLQWFVEWAGNGWQVRFEYEDHKTAYVPADEADNGGMWN